MGRVNTDQPCQCYGGIGRHDTDNAHIDKHSGTIPVILARY